MSNSVNEIIVNEPIILNGMNTESQKEETIEELEARLAKAKSQQAKKLEAQKKAYESKRDENIFKIITTAKTLFKELGEFKQFCHIIMDEQATMLEAYGKIRSNSKGGFSICDAENTMKVTRRRDTEPVWDERSTKAVELIKDFLSDTIKKRDKDMHDILMSFLERNAKGDLEYARVMDLYKHEDKFQDERWKEGLRLIKESFSNHLKGFGYEFKFKTEEGKWENVLLNFSGL
jgi:hypothetical protein